MFNNIISSNICLNIIFIISEFMEKSQSIGKEGKTLLLNRIIEFQQSTGLKLMVRNINTYWYVFLFMAAANSLTGGVRFSLWVFKHVGWNPIQWSNLWINVGNSVSPLCGYSLIAYFSNTFYVNEILLWQIFMETSYVYWKIYFILVRHRID